MTDCPSNSNPSLPTSSSSTTPLPVLYTFRRCPYAIRARLALAHMRIECEIREVILRDKPEEMLLASPKGTVPVMVLPSGVVLEESLDIILYSMSQGDSRGWFPAELKEQEEMVRFIERCDEEFKPSLDGYKYPESYPDKAAEEHRSAAEKFLLELENRLSEHSSLWGYETTIVDIAIFPFIRQFRKIDEKWFEASGYANLLKWVLKWESSDLFLSVMFKTPQWKANASPLCFSHLVAKFRQGSK